jgi:hypothetical protein
VHGVGPSRTGKVIEGRTMKHFIGALAIVAVLAVVSPVGTAAPFEGDTFLSFGTPSGGGGVYQLLNGTYPGDLSSTLFSGTAFPDDGSRNEYTLTGETGFSTLAETPFAVADLFYHNGKTLARTSVTTVPVDMDVYFTSPAGVDRTLSFSFDFALALNSDDPVASADILIPQDMGASTTFLDGTDLYSLELLGFSDDGGNTIIDSFTLAEEANTTSILYAEISLKQGAGGDDAIPEPAALGLIGTALLALRKKRK